MNHTENSRHSKKFRKNKSAEKMVEFCHSAEKDRVWLNSLRVTT